MNYINWDWPQWLLMGWWVFATIFAIGVMVVKPSYKTAGINISIWQGRVWMFTILYFGGFWK